MKRNRQDAILNAIKRRFPWTGNEETTAMTTPRTDYDNPWKEVLEHYFPEFLALFFPDAYADINWNNEHEFLDKELQQVVRDAELGSRRTDKLVRVWRPGGIETWVLVHVEVQVQEEAEFAERMYVYNYRLFDRYRRRVASLAVLGDESPTWRPQKYGYELWGCKAGLEFPVVKLLDYRERWDELDVSHNLFATVVMAHLKAQETRRDEEARRFWKFALIRRMYERGYQRADILELFRFIDWVMVLSETLENELWQEIHALEEERQMPYITSVERIGIQKGIEQGMQQGLQQGMQQGLQQGMLEDACEMVLEALSFKFGVVPVDVVESIQGIQVREMLKQLHRAAMGTETLDAFRLQLQQAIGR